MPPDLLLGARPGGAGVEFRVWAPEAQTAAVVVEKRGTFPLDRDAEYFQGVVPEARSGDRYRYLVDGEGPFPDPASRYQPEGVHGPSEVVDSARFRWMDSAWRTPDTREFVFYELHVGTFSPEGTFDGVRRRLPYLAELGATAIELMPIADFAGDRNWGYDGVALFAPARCYGSPDELRHLVDEAHRHGLAVFLDVVYNHFGPDGAHAVSISSRYLSRRKRSPWGAAVNLDGRYSAGVRRYFIANAIAWLEEYHVDGLRLDATDALVDGSERHFLAQLSDEVAQAMEARGRKAYLIAEDHRNLASLVRPETEGGFGLDGIWSDDFHHEIRRHLAGDSDAHFADFGGTTAEIARTVERGWFHEGQISRYRGAPRGSDPSPIAPPRFVVYIQNHDQVGNRATGDRLNHVIDQASYRAASALLLLAPETPLLFMGQEWAASSPFQYFTDHEEPLGEQVKRGRRREFRQFRAYTDADSLGAIPDPQARETFERCRLPWDEIVTEPHRSVLAMYRALLQLRRTEPHMRPPERSGFAVTAADEHTVALLYGAGAPDPVLVVVCLSGSGVVDCRLCVAPGSRGTATWRPILSTEDPAFTADGARPEVRTEHPIVQFFRPGAVVLKRSTALDRPAGRTRWESDCRGFPPETGFRGEWRGGSHMRAWRFRRISMLR